MLRVYASNQERVPDRRATDLRDGNKEYAFPEIRSAEEWQARARDLREHILVSCGLWPMVDKCDLNARIFGRTERDGYSVEKVCFESLPSFYVTGNLYRPLGRTGPFPAVANPHGHWGDGRLHDDDVGSLPGRCIGFARLGAVAFSYDMVGYNDSNQVSHQYGGERENLWGISLMGLQLLNSIRVIDFLSLLPDVDPTRIGCTGESGGGTQTFMLMAVDDRVKVSSPVNMISAHFQGGCLCENAPNLRIGMFNVEIGALMAPRPMLLVCCTGDWTANTPTVEFPAIQGIYRLLGAPDSVAYVQIDAQHNYNKASREAAYRWFGMKLLGLPADTDFSEKPYHVEAADDLLVWHGIEKPEGAIPSADALTHLLVDDAKRQLEELRPSDEASYARLRESMGTGLRHALGVTEVAPGATSATALGTIDLPEGTAHRLVLSGCGRGDAIPALLFEPAERVEGASAVLVVHSRGTQALVSGDSESARPLVTDLMRQGHLVLAIDVFRTGESYAAGPRPDVGFFTTFNRTDTAERVQDVLTALAFLRSRVDVAKVSLVGLERGGLWALLARPFAGEVEQTVVDLSGFDAANDEAYLHELFVPGLRRVGGLEVAGALSAPGRLLIERSGTVDLSYIQAGFSAIGASGRLRVEPDRLTTQRIVATLAP